ncbi:HD domain-containing phosphohydrolase [Planctomycetota bacterium]
MIAFLRKLELVWKKMLDPLMAKYRFGLVAIGLGIDLMLLFRAPLADLIFQGLRSLFSNAPFKLAMNFDLMRELTSHYFFVPAILILIVGYITGTVLGWAAYEAREKMSKFAQKNSFIERLLSASPVGAVMTDADGVVTYTNSEAHKIFSIEGEESVVGRSLNDLDLIANTVLSETIEKLDNAYAGVFQKEIAFKKTATSPIQWFYCIFSPVSLDTERIGSIGWIHDRTDQHRKHEDVINSIILALTKAIDAKDKGTHEHSVRVRKIALTLARYINLPPENFPRLEYSSLLHDVGKILLPDDIIQGRAKLSEEQKEIIFRLPQYSASFLDGIDDLAEVRDVVYYQKEWFVPPKDEKSNFRPFPGIKSGEAIPIEARIIAVADAFEGMTTEKGYRKAMPKEIALIEFKRSSGIKPTEDEINRLLSHYKQTRSSSMGLDELLSHSRLERQFDFKIVRALEKAIQDGSV